jgi:NAD(P)-dependent dehydrogenase (short-subunit alcohol dehydrogenase family)
MNLSESTVLLTGAADGIGLATARLLAPRVRHLVLHGPQPDEDVRRFDPSTLVDARWTPKQKKRRQARPRQARDSRLNSEAL